MNIPRFLRRLFRVPYDGLRHFGVVEEGVLYRCGQPTAAELQTLIRAYGLRTVVSLRGVRDPEDPDAWEQAERAICTDWAVQFVWLPCNHKNPPTAEQVRRFLDLVQDPARRPVLVHCRIGQQRTLLFCALYRVHVQGVHPEQALSEMDALGFGIRKRRHRRLLETFHRFSAPQALAAAEADPATCG